MYKRMVDSRTHVTDRYLTKEVGSDVILVKSLLTTVPLQIQHEARERYTTTSRNLTTQYQIRHAKHTTVLCFLLAARKLRQQKTVVHLCVRLFPIHVIVCVCVCVFGCVQCLYVCSCVHVCTHVHHVCVCTLCMCLCLSDGCALIPFSHLLIRLCLLYLPICWKQFYIPFFFFPPSVPNTNFCQKGIHTPPILPSIHKFSKISKFKKPHRPHDAL